MNNKDNSQTIFNILAQVISNGTNFILIMLFTKFLSTNNYGVVSIYQAYVLLFSIVVGLNIQGTIGPAFIRLKDNEKKNYLASVYFLAILSFVLILFLITIFIHSIMKFTQLSFELIILMMFHSFGIFTFNFANVKYVYSRNAQKSCIISIILSISMILISFLGIKFEKYFTNEYMIRILGISLPYIFCNIYIAFEILYKSKPFDNFEKNIKFCLPICIPLIFHGLSYILLSQTDKIMLQKILLDLSYVGIYSFIVNFAHVLNAIYTALNNTWVPIYYDLLKKENYNILLRRSKRYLKFYSIIVCGFMILSPEVVKLFANSKYWEGIKLIPIISVSIFMTFLYSFAVNFELYNKESKKIALGTTSAAILNIVLNYFLISKYEYYGAAFATLIAYIILFIFHFLCAKKMKNIKFPYKYNFFVKSILLVFIYSIAFYVLLEHTFIRLILAIILGLILIIDFKKYKTFF